jgi:hypothetical protein
LNIKFAHSGVIILRSLANAFMPPVWKPIVGYRPARSIVLGQLVGVGSNAEAQGTRYKLCMPGRQRPEIAGWVLRDGLR